MTTQTKTQTQTAEDLRRLIAEVELELGRVLGHNRADRLKVQHERLLGELAAAERLEAALPSEIRIISSQPSPHAIVRADAMWAAVAVRFRDGAQVGPVRASFAQASTRAAAVIACILKTDGLEDVRRASWEGLVD